MSQRLPRRVDQPEIRSTRKGTAPVPRTKSPLASNPNPTEEEARAGIEGNICRCTGYERIVEAVLCAARKVKKSK